jgi:hypothetical protein
VKKETFRTLMIIGGIVILMAILGLGLAVWLFTQSVSLGTADQQEATRMFEAVRQRFSGITPVLEMRDDDPVVTRQAPEQGTGTRLTSMRIFAWDPDDRRLSRIDLPFWLLRLKSGPISFANDEDILGRKPLDLTVEQLERYGPTLVLDLERPGGERVLIWTE